MSVVTPLRPVRPVRCACGFLLFDGEAVRSRVVLVHEGLAKCRCKRWVPIPVRAATDNPPP